MSGYKKFLTKPRIMIFVLIIISVLVALFFSQNVNPIIKIIAEDEIRGISTVAINSAVGKVMSEQIGYNDLITIDKDDNGEINLIRTNSAIINNIARQTIILAQHNISELGEQGIAIPIGTLSGIVFLSGKGPSIHIKALPVGSASSKFYSQFVEAGINQTKHTISIEISCDISIIMPGADSTIKTITDVVLCENIIIGKVPDTYLNSTSLDEMMNLIP